ncbi:MAG: ABC transporter substrate-binding protein [Desulfobacteraceae bacterium]|nr:ABC transporter substrate-binding protein [Desulfobacteraceae bacterium]
MKSFGDTPPSRRPGPLLAGVLILVWSLGLWACGDDALIQQRQRHLEGLAENEPIKLAVVWRQGNDRAFIQGVELAVAELNAAGGVAGHRLEIVYVDGFSNLEEARQAVYPLSRDLNVAFALGFYTSDIAGPLVHLTQYYGIPAMINASADEVLKDRWTGGVFRATANTSKIAEVIFAECLKHAPQSVILCYSSNRYTAAIASALIPRLRQAGRIDLQAYRMETVTDEWRFKLTESLGNTKFRQRHVAAILLLDNLQTIQELLSILEPEGGVDLVFASETGFDQVLHMVEKLERQLRIPLYIATDGIHTMMMEREISTSEDTMVARFEQIREKIPNEMMLCGYEQAMTVGQAMIQAESAAPDKVKAALRRLEYQGVFQSYAFTDEGELKAPFFFMVVMDQGHTSGFLR